MGSLLPLGLLLTLAGAPPPGDPTSERPSPVRILTDFDEPRLVARLRELLEDAVPIFERATGHRLPEGEPLILNLYATLRGYQRGTSAAGVSGFMEVGAATAWSNEESFLVVQPRRDPAYLETVAWLPDLTAQLALHEAAHQFMSRAEMYPAQALPVWYSEGVADHLAELALRELVLADQGRCLMLEDSYHTVAAAVAEQRAFPLRQLITLSPQVVSQHAARDLFYDQSAALVRFLVGPGKERWGATMQAYIDDVVERENERWRPPGPARLERAEALRDELLAALPTLEAEWLGGLESSQTPWIERQGSAQWVGDDLLTAALSWQESGYVQSSAPGPDAPRRFECEFRVLDLETGEAGEAFVVLHAPEGPEGGLKLTLQRSGRVSLVGWREGSTSAVSGVSWDLRAAQDFVRLSVDIAGRSLALRIDDAAPLALEAPADYPAPGGAWGLGAWKGAVLWRDVVLE